MARRGEHPYPPSPGGRDSEPPPSREDAREGMRARLESVIPDLIKKAVIGGVDRGMEAQETIRSFISESKLPKEIANALLAQIDQTKDGLFRVVAREIRGFLEAIDWQREMQKLLTTVSFEIKTEIRFIPNDSAPEKIGRPDVKAAMRVKRQGEEERGRKKKRHQREREEPRAEEEEREPEPEPTETPPPVAAKTEEPDNDENE